MKGEIDIINIYDHKTGKIIVSDDTVTINIRYPYEIALDRIKTPENLLHWCWHLGEKNWMDAQYMRVFIEKVCNAKKWDLDSFWS